MPISGPTLTTRSCYPTTARWAIKTLVTGADGFFGRHVCARLRKGRHGLIETTHKNSELTEYISPSVSGAFDLFDTCKPEAVIHLAARCGGIGANRRSPGTFWRDNLLMGINVLDAAKACDVKKVVMVSTVCAYPKCPPTIPFKEENIFDGYPEETNAPYGIAKRALLVGARAYREQFGLNVVTLVPTNLYGPGDHFDPEISHVIPAMILKMREAKTSGMGEVVLWGSGKATRDFLYVEDAAEAVEMAMETYSDPEPLNLGSGVEISMRDLAVEISRIVGFDGKISWDASKPDGQPRRVLDFSRARKKLGWVSKTPFVSGLEKTFEWYANRFEAGCAR